MAVFVILVYFLLHPSEITIKFCSDFCANIFLFETTQIWLKINKTTGFNPAALRLNKL